MVVGSCDRQRETGEYAWERVDDMDRVSCAWHAVAGRVDVGMTVVFFKQKTAYELRISDWRSDVCSSDLREGFAEEAVLDRLGVGVGCVEAPRRGRRIILGDLEIGRVRLGFDAVLAQQQVAESRWRVGPG